MPNTLESYRLALSASRSLVGVSLLIRAHVMHHAAETSKLNHGRRPGKTASNSHGWCVKETKRCSGAQRSAPLVHVVIIPRDQF